MKEVSSSKRKYAVPFTPLFLPSESFDAILPRPTGEPLLKKTIKETTLVTYLTQREGQAKDLLAVPASQIHDVIDTKFQIADGHDGNVIASLKGSVLEGSERLFYVSDMMNHAKNSGSEEAKTNPYSEVVLISAVELLANGVVDRFVSAASDNLTDDGRNMYERLKENDLVAVHTTQNGNYEVTYAHDVATQRADIDLVSRPFIAANTPCVRYKGRAKEHESHINVDTQMITDELLKSGFNEKDAKGFAITFHHAEDKDAQDRSDTYGWNNDNLTYDTVGDNLIYYPLNINVVINNDSAHSSNVAWHEFGHVHHKKVKKVERTPLYQKHENLDIAEKVGKNAQRLAVASAIGVEMIDHGTLVTTLVGSALLAGAGILIAKNPKYTLWQIDSGEIYARKFAYDRRKLEPIQYDQTRQ